jgi:hypothetical protein
MHNPGSNGRKYAQSRIPGPAWCTTLDPRASSMHNPGFKASSMQTSANIRRTSANKGQQLRSPAGRLEFPQVINAGPVLDAVPSMDPWGPICSSLE